MDFTTLPTDLPEQNGKLHVPGDPDPDPSSLDSSSNKYILPNDNNFSKSIKKIRDKNKKCHKHKKQDASYSSSSESDFSDDSDYRRKIRKKKSY